MLLLFIAAVLSGCNGGFDDTKSKGESKRTDSILKNVRSVDSLRMLVKTYHDSHDTRAEVIEGHKQHHSHPQPVGHQLSTYRYYG